MLLDFRIMLTASIAAVVLLIGGFGMLAAVRTPGKPSVAIPRDPSEVTGSIRAGGERAHILTDEDKAAEPASPVAAPKPPAPAPIREAKAETPEKAEAAKGTEPEKPAPPRAAARPKPRAPAAARQESGANFRANNPLAFPFFGLGTNTGQ